MADRPEMRALPCFKCGKELKQVFPEGNHRNHPYNAVTFETSGQYGSTVFDEIDGAKLEINICDHCLVGQKEIVLHLDGIPKREWKPWIPDHE